MHSLVPFLTIMGRFRSRLSVESMEISPGYVCKGDECKTHPCFEFISHAILRILYPYSCKTHNISSKLGFVGLLMKSK